MSEFDKETIIKELLGKDLDGLKGVENGDLKYRKSKIYLKRNFIRDCLYRGDSVTKICSKELEMNRADFYRYVEMDPILWTVVTYFNKHHKHCQRHKRITS